MAHVDIYSSGSWHELWGQKEQWMRDNACLVIIPEDEERTMLEPLFPELAPGQIITIPELVERYVMCCLGKKGIISQHAVESILGSIINEGFASYLKIEKYKQGYTKALADFICSFRKTSNLDLKTALEGFKTGSVQLTSKEDDLLRLYKEYISRLSDDGYDFKSGLEHFVQHTDENNIHRHLGMEKGRRIVFWGFNYVTPLESEFITSLFKNAERVVFLSCEDPAVSGQAVKVHNSVKTLLEKNKGSIKTHTAALSKQDSFFVHLSRRVFQDRAMPDDMPGEDGLSSREKVFLSKENNRFEEVVSMVRQLRHLMENGVSPGSIHIAVPESHLYGMLVQEVFTEYGIPFVLEEGLPLLSYPLAALVYNLANQCTSQNPFPLREKIFSSSYTSFESLVKPADLEKYQQKAGVELLSPETIFRLFPQDAALSALDFSFLKNLRQKAYRAVDPAQGTPRLEVIRQYLEGAEDADRAEQEKKQEKEREKWKLKCLIQLYLLDRAEKDLSVFPSRVNAAGFKKSLLELLSRFQVKEKINSGKDNEMADPLLQYIQERDKRILKQLEGILEQLSSCLAPLEDVFQEKLTRQEVVRIFSRLLSEAQLPAAHTGQEGNGEGVWVQAVGRGCYRSFDYTFICGLVDGEFPPREDFNFLQPKKEGLSLGWSYSVVDHARNHLYHLIRSTTKALFISAPASHNGRKLPLSPFMVEMEKCLPPAADKAGKGNDEIFPREDRLLSRREKLIFIGKNVDHNYEKTRPLLKEVLDVGESSDQLMFRDIHDIHDTQDIYDITGITEILRFDGLSLNARDFSEFDGIFSNNAAALELLRNELGQLAYTPADMERYAACPLRFFFDNIMSLKEEKDYHPDTAEHGTVIRSILKAYTKWAVQNGEVPAGAEEFIRELIYRHYGAAAADVKDAFEARFLKQLLAGLEGTAAKRPGLFCSFLAREREPQDLLKPYLANLGGTLQVDEDLDVRVEVDRLDLTLAADLCMVYNYSTADTGDPLKIKKGLRFSLPLALMFIEEYLAEKKINIPLVGGGVYLVRSPKNIRRGGYFALKSIKASRQDFVSQERPIFSGQRHGFIADEDFPEVLNKLREQLSRLHKMMKKGVFHLPLCSEKDQECSNCSFGRVCRKDQLRLDRLFVNLRDDHNIHIVEEIV